MAGIQEVHDLLVKGKAKMIVGAVQEALDAGCDPAQLLNEGMIGAMDEVGVKFKNGEIFVPEMLVAARAMKKGVEVLKPHLASGAAGAAGKVVIGTVAGDLHDIGCYDAGIRRIRSNRPGCGCSKRKIRRNSGSKSGYQDRMLLCSADHYHAGSERCC